MRPLGLLAGVLIIIMQSPVKLIHSTTTKNPFGGWGLASLHRYDSFATFEFPQKNSITGTNSISAASRFRLQLVVLDSPAVVFAAAAS